MGYCYAVRVLPPSAAAEPRAESAEMDGGGGGLGRRVPAPERLEDSSRTARPDEGGAPGDADRSSAGRDTADGDGLTPRGAEERDEEERDEEERDEEDQEEEQE